MASSPSDPGARAMAKQLKVLLPPSFHKLRISDELAGCFDDASAISDSGKGVPLGPTALVVSPFGKVWRVEVGRDGDGAFLGRGWPEFLAAHGVGVGWFVVLRHQGGGVLTFKAFDTSFCIKEFAAPAAAMASRSSKRISSKPQFIRITYPDFSEKMIIPARFVKKYITEDCMNRRTAVISSPLGKFWQIELEKNQSGMFFTGGWSNFLEFHGISKGDILLLRYEGNMVFKFKAFGLSGCQKDFKNQDVHVKTQNNIEMQQESTPPIRKRKSKSSSEENKRQKSSVTSLNRKLSQKKPDYQIGPSCWIRKEISTYALERFLSLPVKFCHSIGFRKACTIMLKTEMDNTRTWQVRGLVYEKVCYLVGVGWRCFCKDNKMKKDDLCTFNIIETTLWHVVITRSSKSGKIDKKKQPICSSSMEHKSNSHMSDIEMQQESTPPIRKRKSKSSSEENERQKSSVTSLNRKPSQKKPDYQIGPSCWIRKEISTYTLENLLSLSIRFFRGIGLLNSCRITLKTEMDSTRSWEVYGTPYKNYFCIQGDRWKSFCQDVGLKKGDLCTFNIMKTTLWHVTIEHSPTLANTKRQKESPCSSSKEHKTKKGSSSSKEGMRPKGSVNSFSKASRYTTSVYEIGPPSWIRKEMNNNSITKHLSLAVNFCSAIGLQKRCTITLKTSTNSRSWKVRGLMHKTGSYQIGPGWIKFCRENRLKVGDICTFNVIKTLLWHVVITRH